MRDPYPTVCSCVGRARVLPGSAAAPLCGCWLPWLLSSPLLRGRDRGRLRSLGGELGPSSARALGGCRDAGWGEMQSANQAPCQLPLSSPGACGSEICSLALKNAVLVLGLRDRPSCPQEGGLRQWHVRTVTIITHRKWWLRFLQSPESLPRNTATASYSKGLTDGPVHGAVSCPWEGPHCLSASP